MKKIILSIITLLFISISVQSQTDTEFWLACPDLNENHAGCCNKDQPILLQLTAQDKPATVYISQPALGWEADPIYLEAYQTYTYVLTSRKNYLECVDADSIENKGLHIISTAPITSIYKVTNRQNSDMIVLKGKTALGTYFFIPGQNQFSVPEYASQSHFSCDIVATEDSTKIRITPKKDIIGHSYISGAYFIYLNKGQTYSIQIPSSAKGIDRPIGSEIQSNKPIAVSMKDCSITINTVSTYTADVIMDQIVPVEYLGTEYIIARGTLTNPNNDFLFITATEDDTEIFIGGFNEYNLLERTLQKGETYTKEISLSSHVSASKPIYVFHITGCVGEAAGALISPIQCSGSNSITYSWATEKNLTAGTTDSIFGYTPTENTAIILVRQGSEDGLYIIDSIVNGEKYEKKLNIFSYSPSANSEWIVLSIYSFSRFGNKVTIYHKEGDLFHFAVIQGDNASCRYGFLSDFKRANIKPIANNLNSIYCEGDALKITATPYEGVTYTWLPPNDKPITGTFTDGHKANIYQKENLTLSDAGIYRLVTDKGCNSDTSSIKVTIYPNPQIKLPNDTAFCSGKTIKLNATGAMGSELLTTTYEWFPTGDTTNFIIIDPNPGTTTYGVIVTNKYPTITCHSSDSIKVNISEVPAISFITNPNPARGYEPLEVSFMNNTDPSTSLYLWKFGDGSTSTETNPTHTFVVQDPNADSVTYDITLIAKTSDFCIDSLAITGIITVLNDPTYNGIINIGKDEIKLHIYPNPATSALTLDNDKKALGKVELYTTNGICVFKEDFNQATLITIPINHLPAGTYLLKVNGQIKKVIKY